MNVENASLFREEAIRHRADRLYGDVNVVMPVAWQAVGFLLLAALAVTIVFFSLATYSRVETVLGAVALDKGVATIVPTRPGIVETIAVSEGQTVRAGQKLVTVRAEESLINGATAPQRIHGALMQQDTQLADQGKLLLQASGADQSRLKAQIDGDLAAITSLQMQIDDQRELVTSAEPDYRNAQGIAARGFISKRDLEQRRATILTRHQQLAQLQQTVSDKRADITQAGRAIAQSAMSAQAQAASALSSRASLSQQQAQTDLAQGYALRSPVAGRVTALTARLGQPVTPDQQVMMVVPANARPRVELYVPTASAGFLAPGQEVRLSIDAFPYQTFGTIRTRIMTISQAAVARPSANGPVPVYLVTAAVSDPWVMAFGRRQALLPGMTLTARIVTEKRSLIKWLFEPLFAVRKR